MFDMTGKEKVATEALSTHVRYYVPLTVEEYTYMVDSTTAPLVTTIQAAARMPLYDRINGLLEQSHCYPFMAYMHSNSNVYTATKDGFYILEIYVSQHALHAHVEDSTMCLFSRDHLSPTLSFDYNFKFSSQEQQLQRIYRVTLHGGATLTTPLEIYSFSTGFAWDFWVIVSFEDLLQNLEGSEDPPTWAIRFLYNWTCYAEHLIYDIEIDPTTTNKILKLMHVHGMPTPKKSSRTMDYLRGATEALETYKNIPTDDLKKAVEEWRVEAVKATTPAVSSAPESTSAMEISTEAPPAKRRAT